MRCFVTQEIDKSRRVIEKLLFSEQILSTLETVAEVCVDSLYDGGRVLFCGDSDRAADCQLLARELTDRLGGGIGDGPAIALSDDIKALTTATNRCESQFRFAHHLESIGRDGDVVIGISTDGNSKAVLDAMTIARDRGLPTIGLTGCDGGQLLTLCDHLIIIPSHDPVRIQEGHIVLGHVLCGLIEKAMLADEDIRIA